MEATSELMISWINQTEIPIDCTNIAQIDDSHIIAIEDTSSHFEAHIYDSITNKWELFTKLEDSLNSAAHTIASNPQLSEVIAFTDRHIIQINMKSKEINVRTMDEKLGSGGYCLFINNDYHLFFFGLNNDKHIKLNINRKTHTHKLETMHILSAEEKATVYMRAIHLKSQEKVLVFGGLKGWNDYQDTVHCYDIVENKWSELEVRMPIGVHRFGCVKTKDEKYVVLMGGYNNSERINKIQVFDVDKTKFGISKIKCPKNGSFQAVNTLEDADEILIAGYVRIVLNEYEMIMPDDIIHFIIDLMRIERVHLMEDANSSHWKIDVQCIVDQCVDFVA